MPLEQGSSREVIQRNIAKLISEGYSVSQAVAIANAEAKRSKEGNRNG